MLPWCLPSPHSARERRRTCLGIRLHRPARILKSSEQVAALLGGAALIAKGGPNVLVVIQGYDSVSAQGLEELAGLDALQRIELIALGQSEPRHAVGAVEVGDARLDQSHQLRAGRHFGVECLDYLGVVDI